MHSGYTVRPTGKLTEYVNSVAQPLPCGTIQIPYNPSFAQIGVMATPK